MKSTAVCILMIVGFVGAYYSGLFDLFAAPAALPFALGIAAGALAVAAVVLGNPLGKRKKAFVIARKAEPDEAIHLREAGKKDGLLRSARNDKKAGIAARPKAARNDAKAKKAKKK